MKSLIPLLRLVFRHRSTLVMSIVCSLLVGVLWGLNIGALYPVLNVVFKGETPQSTARAEAKRVRQEKKQSQDAAAQGPVASAQAESGEPAPPAGATGEAPPKIAARQGKLFGSRWAADLFQRITPSDPFAMLALVVAIVIVGTVLRGMFQAANEMLVSRLSQRVLFQLRVGFFRQTLRLDLATLATDRTSRLMSRFTHDMTRINEGLNALLGHMIPEPMKILTCLIGAALVSWRLLLVALVVAPPTILILRFLIRSLRQANNESMAAMPTLYAQLERSFATIKLVKTYNMERVERRRFLGDCRAILERIRRVSRYRSFIRPATEVMTIAGVSLAVLVGSYLVIHRTTHVLGVRVTERPLQPASLMMFYAFLMGASEPMKKLAGAAFSVQRTAVAMDRIQQLMDRTPTVVDPPRPRPLPRPLGRLEMENVRFAYARGAPVLKGVSLSLEAGETVAILGANGCGKSTLVNLIPRLYDASGGRIRLGGVDVRDVRMRELRSRIAMVAQETLLLDDTIFNNIRYGAESATVDEVLRASRLAQAHQFIETQLEEGYDTIVGERGGFLSGGQRQRIALARALLRNTEILILDEATSEIDAASEPAIYRAIQQSAADRMTIVIAHGPGVLEIADRIVVLDGGVVQAEGTRAELLADKMYCEMLLNGGFHQAA